jgi:hypothetical protein
MLLKVRVTVTALVEIRLFGTTLVSRPDTVYFYSRIRNWMRSTIERIHNPGLNATPDGKKPLSASAVFRSGSTTF